MGTGLMRMTRADPVSGVDYDLALTIAGMSFKADCAIHFEPSTEGSTVVWTTTMDLSDSRWKRGLGRLISKGMTQAFDEGLAALKREAEAFTSAPGR
jgi:hypothetical protein